MDAKVEALLKDQVNKEFYSAYLYLAISNYYAGENLDGFAHWYEVQAREEQEHAMKILKYLQDLGIKLELAAIDAPNVNYSDLRQPLEQALNHEKYVTSLIHGIYTAASEARDYLTVKYMDWFVTEQGEEEKNATDLLAKYDMFKGDVRGVYMMNNELRARA